MGIPDQNLTPLATDHAAQINGSVFNADYSELEIVERVFGSWLEKHVLSAINVRLHAKRGTVTPAHQKLYNTLDSVQLLRVFLAKFIWGLLKHEKHNIKSAKLEHLRSALFGENHRDAVLGCFDIGNETMKSISESIALHLKEFIIPGSGCCVDESVFPHYGKKAEISGQLTHIPGKPYDYGMVSYLLTQRLLLSRLSICLAICPVFVQKNVTPTEAALSLLAAVPHTGNVLFRARILYADSLWSQPASLNQFSHLKLAFTIAIQPSNSAWRGP